MEIELSRGGVFKEHSRSELFKKLTGSWEARLVFEMMGLKNCLESPRELAKVAGIPLENVFDAYDLLIETGLVKKTLSGYEKMQKHVDYTKINESDAQELANYALITSEILSRLTPQGECRFENSFVATNKVTLKKFLDKLNSTVAEFIDESDKADNKEMVVGLQSSIVNMTQNASLNGGEK